MAKETTIEVNGNPIPVLQFDHPAQEIDNAVEMVKKHASRHAANGPDPITPSAIGAAPAGLSNHIYVYVSTTGNDETGDGTEETPFSTIQKAVDSLPKNLNGHNAYIYVFPGTYSGSINVNGFYGGNFYLRARDISTRPTIVGNVMCSSCVVALFWDINIEGNIDALFSPCVDVSNCQITSPSAFAVRARDNSIMNIINCKLIATGSEGFTGAITCSNSIVHANNCIIDEVTIIGIASQYSGVVYHSKTANNAATAETTYYGFLYSKSDM